MMNTIIEELGPQLRSQYRGALSCPMEWRMIDAFANLQEAGNLVDTENLEVPAAICLGDESRFSQGRASATASSEIEDDYGPDSGC